MYRIDKKTNNLIQVEVISFCEQENSQVWINKILDHVCEDQELLIIQKEFDGFDHNHQRLDILALDKNGDLVIVENNLGNTEQDGIRQALKYAAYCSVLTTLQVIQVYQDYLNCYNNGEDAKSNIMKFIEKNGSELELNKDKQSIIFVAECFRKDMIYPVLWMHEYDIKIKCLKLISFKVNDEVFVEIEQLIPLPKNRQLISDVKKEIKNTTNSVLDV